MVSDLKEAMDANEPIATQGFPRTLGKFSEEEEESRRRYHLWGKRLRRRIYFLKQSRLKSGSWENELKCQAEDSILHTPESRMVIIPETPVQMEAEKNRGMGKFITPPAQVRHNPNWMKRKELTTSLPPNIVPITSQPKRICVRQAVPGLPKTIEEVVLLWRRGDAAKGYKAMHLLHSAKSRRRELGESFDNDWWVGAGQKCAFQRIKKLIALVAAEGGVPIFKIGCEDGWLEGIRRFHTKYDTRGQQVPLSTILRNIGRDKNRSR